MKYFFHKNSEKWGKLNICKLYETTFFEKINSVIPFEELIRCRKMGDTYLLFPKATRGVPLGLSLPRLELLLYM
jgi:hypothetical protein